MFGNEQKTSEKIVSSKAIENSTGAYLCILLLTPTIIIYVVYIFLLRHTSIHIIFIRHLSKFHKEKGWVEKEAVEKGGVEKGWVEKWWIKKEWVVKGWVEKGWVLKGWVVKGWVEKGWVEKERKSD